MSTEKKIQELENKLKTNHNLISDLEIKTLAAQQELSNQNTKKLNRIFNLGYTNTILALCTLLFLTFLGLWFYVLASADDVGVMIANEFMGLSYPEASSSESATQKMVSRALLGLAFGFGLLTYSVWKYRNLQKSFMHHKLFSKDLVNEFIQTVQQIKN